MVCEGGGKRFRAAGQGFLGVMYENGFGVAQDHEMSLHWYRKAAEQEDSTAQFNLARMCYQGTDRTGLRAKRQNGSRKRRIKTMIPLKICWA